MLPARFIHVPAVDPNALVLLVPNGFDVAALEPKPPVLVVFEPPNPKKIRLPLRQIDELVLTSGIGITKSSSSVVVVVVGAKGKPASTAKRHIGCGHASRSFECANKGMKLKEGRVSERMRDRKWPRKLATRLRERLSRCSEVLPRQQNHLQG